MIHITLSMSWDRQLDSKESQWLDLNKRSDLRASRYPSGLSTWNQAIKDQNHLLRREEMKHGIKTFAFAFAIERDQSYTFELTNFLWCFLFWLKFELFDGPVNTTHSSYNCPKNFLYFRVQEYRSKTCLRCSTYFYLTRIPEGDYCSQVLCALCNLSNFTLTETINLSVLGLNWWPILSCSVQSNFAVPKEISRL